MSQIEVHVSPRYSVLDLIEFWNSLLTEWKNKIPNISGAQRPQIPPLQNFDLVMTDGWLSVLSRIKPNRVLTVDQAKSEIISIDTHTGTSTSMAKNITTNTQNGKQINRSAIDISRFTLLSSIPFPRAELTALDEITVCIDGKAVQIPEVPSIYLKTMYNKGAFTHLEAMRASEIQKKSGRAGSFRRCWRVNGVDHDFFEKVFLRDAPKDGGQARRKYYLNPDLLIYLTKR